jgi:hypothetical protein
MWCALEKLCEAVVACYILVLFGRTGTRDKAISKRRRLLLNAVYILKLSSDVKSILHQVLDYAEIKINLSSNNFFKQDVDEQSI